MTKITKIKVLEGYTSEEIGHFQSSSLRENIKGEIVQLKAELAALDYKTIKRLQGVLSDEDWEQTKAECAALRARINDLEAELAEIEEI